MKLSQDAITTIERLAGTALTAGIKKIIIADGKIRGIDDKQTVVIMSTDGVPDLQGKTLSINRLPELAARLNLVKSQGINIEATIATGGSGAGTDISVLDISGGKTKAQFRCAALESMKGVPKNTVDTDAWQFTLSTAQMPTIIQGISAMASETVTFASKDGQTVLVEVLDSNKDMFTTELDGQASWIGADTAGTSFCQSYPSKTLVALLKEALRETSVVSVKIGKNGILSVSVNSFNFCVLPAAV